MKNKNTAGVLLLCVGVVLALCSLPGLLQTYVVGDSAMLSALRQENALFDLLMSHAPETAGLGVVFLLLGLLLIVKLPGPREEAEETETKPYKVKNPQEAAPHAENAPKENKPPARPSQHPPRERQEPARQNDPLREGQSQWTQPRKQAQPQSPQSRLETWQSRSQQAQTQSAYSSQWIQPRSRPQPQQPQSNPQTRQSQSQVPRPSGEYPSHWIQPRQPQTGQTQLPSDLRQDFPHSGGDEASPARADNSPKEYRVSFSETE